MSIFIGGAWPYANGSLHLGHIASLLPGDILARYYRLKGEKVLYVSGSDCHGTPISVRAKKEHVKPEEIAGYYHNEFKNCFEGLGFSYDLYCSTEDEFHKKEVQKVFRILLEKGYIYKKGIEQVFCENCNQFLPDRYVEGICPHCGNTARGDQCDYCSSLLDPLELKERRCKICGSEPIVKHTEHYFLALSKFQEKLENFIENSKGFRENSVNLSLRYLREGLKDRAVTRDLSWGIDVPVEGFEKKKIYVWIDAVIGYLSASKQWAKENNKNWEEFWGEDVTSYFVHGKDNIPFHTIILPSILLAIGGLHLPDRIISSEYLTIEGKKLSTSNNWAVWVPYIIKNYNPDSIRYFLTINGPEKRDTDFSWREFIYSHNGELLGAFGNFVNRTLEFIWKKYDGSVPEGKVCQEIKDKIIKLYNLCGNKIEQGEFKSSIEDIFSLVRFGNKYFDENQPWKKIKEDKKSCDETIYNCLLIIANLANLLNPYVPFCCKKIKKIINLKEAKWEYQEIPENHKINEPEILFDRIDKSKIEEETKKMSMSISRL